MGNSMDNILEVFKNKTQIVNKGISNLVGDVREYFKTSSYEEDLDSVINALHAYLKKNPRPKFSDKFSSRVKEKRNYLLKQAGLFIGAGALLNIIEPLKMGEFDPNVLAMHALKGAGEAILVIIITVSGVIVKRILNGVTVTTYELTT